MLAWIFFRSASITQGFSIVQEIFSPSLFTFPERFSSRIIVLIIILVIIEWLQRDKEHALDFTGLRIPAILRYTIYYAVILSILIFTGKTQEFIYFQF
jgi:hypothetical protein